MSYFVLDTNVLLNDPTFLSRNVAKDGEKIHIVVPVYALKELDTFKKSRDEVLGANARAVIRQLDALASKGSLVEGVDNGNNSIVHVGLRNDVAIDEIEGILGNAEHQEKDFYILATTFALANEGHDVVLYTHDNCLRVQAGILGLKVNQTLDYTELYTGRDTILVEEEKIAEFFQQGNLFLPGTHYPNQAITLVDGNNAACRALGVVSPDSGLLVPLGTNPRERLLNRVVAQGEEQQFLINFLLDPKIDLLTISGEAGTGKTLLALAAALEMTMEKRLYDKVIVARPLIPMGEDIGFLPGTKQQKLESWMSAIFDGLDFLFGQSEAQGMASQKGAQQKGGGQRGGQEKARFYMDFVEKFVEIDALTYIRGRSLPRQIIFIDESQNGSFHEMKTIITRAGEGTKVILAGDPTQIDNRFLSATSNGLSATIECWKDSAIAAHLSLTSVKRSRLASEAVWRMKKNG
jgi:PhoH-like ATPase